MRYVIERYRIRLPKNCDMDMLDRELGRYLIAGYSASITDNKMCSHVDLLAEKKSIFTTGHVVNCMYIYGSGHVE